MAGAVIVLSAPQRWMFYENPGGKLTGVLVMPPANTFVVHPAKGGLLQGVFGPYAPKPEVTRAIAQAIGGNCRFGI